MRYVLHPGNITSMYDGDVHFIDGPTLARLYGINYHFCVYGNDAKYVEKDGDVHLYPNYFGNYALPQEDKK